MEETKVTPEQQKELNKLGYKFLVGNFFSGVHHSAMLLVINFIIFMVVALIHGPEFLAFICSIVAAIFIFSRMRKITKQSHDRLLQDVKKIIGR